MHGGEKKPLYLDWVTLVPTDEEPPPEVVEPSKSSSICDDELEERIERQKFHVDKMGPHLPDGGAKLKDFLRHLEEEQERRRRFNTAAKVTTVQAEVSKRNGRYQSELGDRMPLPKRTAGSSSTSSSQQSVDSAGNRQSVEEIATLRAQAAAALAEQERLRIEQVRLAKMVEDQARLLDEQGRSQAEMRAMLATLIARDDPAPDIFQFHFY